MCTCINIISNYTYFGRNLDLDYSFNEQVIITPRNFPIKFKKEKDIPRHYAFIGIGTIIDYYPLYAEASNEYGLSIAGLNFPDNCFYYKFDSTKKNYAPYELVLLILSTCKNLKEVKELLKKINILKVDFKKDIKLTPLHFMVSDKKASIVIETLKDGMKIYENSYQVLTNNPPFTYHLENIKNFLQIHNKDAIDLAKLNLKPYSYGQGAMGLPGDFSSASRFIKTCFIKNYLLLNNEEKHDVLQFFKCLDSVSMVKGSVKTNKDFEYSRYTSCINVNKSILYYKTYDNPQISKVEMRKEKLNSNKLIVYKFDNEYCFKNEKKD